MKPEVYAKAMFALKESGKNVDDVVNGTVASLKSRGALKLLPKILSAYKSLTRKMSSKGAVLTIARPGDESSALKESSAPEGVNIKIDSNLIGGYRLESDGKLVDNSFKSVLLQIYRNTLAK